MNLFVKFSVFLCWLIFATTLQGEGVKSNCASSIAQSKKLDQIDVLSRNKKEMEKNLFDAIKKHDEDGVKKLITDGVDVNVRKDGCNVIMYAIKKTFHYMRFDCKHPAYLDHSSDHPADIKGKKRFVPSKNIIRLLLDAGAKFDDNKFWLIGFLASVGDSELTEALIKNKLHLLCNEFLLCAANCGNYEAFKLVLTEYPDVNIQFDDEGGSPLTAAVSEWHHTEVINILKIVEALLEKCANVNHKNKYGESVLAIAAINIPSNSNPDVIKLLLKHGADLYSKTNKDFGPDYQSDDFLRRFPDASILKYAIYGENKDVVELMLDQGLDFEEKDSDGKTPLHWAAENNVSIANLLLTKGVNVNAIDNDGRTPLINCIYNKRYGVECVATLVKFEANTKIVDFHGKTAMNYLCQNCDDANDSRFIKTREILKYPQKNRLIQKAPTFNGFTRFSMHWDPGHPETLDRSLDVNSDLLVSYEFDANVIRRLFKSSDRVLIYYPRISNDSCFSDALIKQKINEILKPKFTKHYKNSLKVDEFYYCNFEAWLISNLIIIMREEYSYFESTDTELDKQKSFYINARTGQFYTISDLFKKDANFNERIAKIICNGNVNLEKSFKLKNNCILIKDGIEVYFDKMNAVRYGKQIFKIKYADIDDLIDKDGEMYKATTAEKQSFDTNLNEDNKVGAENNNKAKSDPENDQSEKETAATWGLPQDLLFNGIPLDPGVIEAMAFSNEPKKISECINKDLKRPGGGYFGYEYIPEELLDSGEDRYISCSWNYLGTLEDDKTHVISTRSEDMGPCPLYFDEIFLMQRDGDFVKNIKKIAEGREGRGGGNGGIYKTYFKDKNVFIEQKRTHCEFFKACLEVLAEEDKSVIFNSDYSKMSLKYNGISIPRTVFYKSLPDCCANFCGFVTSSWHNGAFKVTWGELTIYDYEYFDNDDDIDEDRFFSCNLPLFHKCFKAVVARYSKPDKKKLDRDGMKNFAREVLDLYLQKKKS